MAEADTLIKFGDIVIASATFLGPIFAVQAQKFLETRREKKTRQFALFRTLMATRVALLSPAHVEALNAVPYRLLWTAEDHGCLGGLLQTSQHTKGQN